jgi:5-methylcytosine-specific restriction endonuclease McrA
MKVVHVHHRKYRSRGGTNALTNLLGVCRSHHDWTHAHGGFGQPANVLRLALSAGEDETL